MVYIDSEDNNQATASCKITKCVSLLSSLKNSCWLFLAENFFRSNIKTEPTLLIHMKINLISVEKWRQYLRILSRVIRLKSV